MILNFLSSQFISKPIAQSTFSLITSYYPHKHIIFTVPPGILPWTMFVLRSVVDFPAPWKFTRNEFSLSRSCLESHVLCKHRMSRSSKSASTTNHLALSAALWPNRRTRVLYEATHILAQGVLRAHSHCSRHIWPHSSSSARLIIVSDKGPFWPEPAPEHFNDLITFHRYFKRCKFAMCCVYLLADDKNCSWLARGIVTATETVCLVNCRQYRSQS